MTDPLARNDWIGPREDRWTDILPPSWQSAINTSPTVTALQKFLTRPSFDEYVKSWQDTLPGNSPIDRIADRKSTIASEYPDPMNPLAASMLDKGGFLANFIGPGAKLPPPPAPKPQGIRAYHGSPHDFDKFDMSRIGTGEGAQAYGRGLYFAESEGVAKSYRDDLAFKAAPTKPTYQLTSIDFANEALDKFRHLDLSAAKEAAVADLNSQIGLSGRLMPKSMLSPWARMQRRAVDLVQQANDFPVVKQPEPPPPRPTGHLYEVRINADPEQFLDWENLSPKRQAELRTRDGVSRSRERGEAGVKYLDEDSRAVGAGTHNYVVFDDKMIEILRKYGLLPPVAAGAANAVTQGQDQQF